MARICHTNNCPVGVATQQEELRKKFPGTPGDIVNYFILVANEVRTEGLGLGWAGANHQSHDTLLGHHHILPPSRSVACLRSWAFVSSTISWVGLICWCGAKPMGAP